MTPKQRLFPVACADLKNHLEPQGWKLRGDKLWAKLSDDVEALIWPMTLRPTESGCIDVRLVCWVFSEEFAVVARGHRGGTDWNMAAITLEVSRLRNRQDRIMWHVCNEEQGRAVGQEMLSLVSTFLLPRLKTWTDADAIARSLGEDGRLLADVGPGVIEKWLEKFGSARTGG